MSHDILGSSTSVDTDLNDDQQANSEARVPVEVVIQGESDSSTPPTVQMVIETVVQENAEVEVAAMEPADIEPSKEMEMLLGVSAKSKKKAAKAAKAAESALVSKSEPVVTAAQEPAIKKAIAKSEPVEPVEPVEQVKSVQEEIPSEKASVIVPSVEQAAIEEVSTKADATDDAQAVEVKSEVKSVKSEVKSVKSEVKSVKSEVKSVESEVKSVEIEATEPVEIEAVESVNPFEEMGLSPDVLKAIVTAGYETPSPIQSETVPLILAGRDLIGHAETGSGKTAAFAWPLLSKVDLKLARPQILVLAPTRELAIQVTAAFQKYGSGMKGFRAVTIYGGQSYETQLRAIQRGVHVVVGTPGRMMDHLRRKTLNLDTLKALVLDEADEMLRMGFIDDVEWILEQIPAKRQILSFSATMPEPIQRIARRHLNDPAHISIKSKSKTADSINQSCMFVQAREKMERLTRLIETEETDGVLVFVKTKNTTIVVAEALRQRGMIASALNGDIPQNQRERTVNQLKSGRINVVVATDVAARGLDVQRISHVINYDFPHDTEAYVHRIGRTGRAGRSGAAILFVEPKEKGKLGRLQRDTNQRIDQFKQKSIEQVNELRVAKFKQQITDSTEHDQIKYFTKLISDFQNESGLPFGEIAGALAVLAQGDTPLLLKELTSAKSNWRDKNSGGDKGGRERGQMTTYRVEVGRSHGVGPGNIVGAVTNEGNLNNSDIGRINIFDQFSTIDLPSDLTADVIDLLQGVHVSGQRLGLSKSDRTYAKSGGRRSGPSSGGGRYEKKSYGDKKYGKKPYEKKPYEKKAYGDKKPGEKSYSKKYEGGSSDGGNRSNAVSSSNSSSSKPYEKKSYGDKKYADKKPTEKSYTKKYEGGSSDDKSRSNASSSLDRSGDKPGGYVSRKSKSSFGNDDSKNFEKKRKPKTKAAEKARNSRKPGAKPSSPMKKYVKIRSAK